MLAEPHTSQRDMLVGDLLAERHAGCGGQAGKPELRNTAQRVGGSPVRWIMLRGPQARYDPLGGGHSPFLEAHHFAV
jgi:hypothetical protein